MHKLANVEHFGKSNRMPETSVFAGICRTEIDYVEMVEMNNRVGVNINSGNENGKLE